MVEEIVRVGERYVIVIPKKIRKKVRLKKGQYVKMRVQGTKIIIEPIYDDPFKVFAEILGDFQYTRETRIEAQKKLIEEAES